MISRFLRLLMLGLLLLGANEVFAQPDTTFPGDASTRSGRSRRTDPPKTFKEMLAKQRAERDKRDHRQMLERGEAALRLAEQLENSFANNKTISKEDMARLESLEDAVVKIRKELGGDDDSVTFSNDSVDERPSNVEEAFKFLQSTTVKLVDELKKTTRFTISAVAIQSSNSVLNLVKFLRFKK